MIFFFLSICASYALSISTHFLRYRSISFSFRLFHFMCFYFSRFQSGYVSRYSLPLAPSLCTSRNIFGAFQAPLTNSYYILWLSDACHIFCLPIQCFISFGVRRQCQWRLALVCLWLYFSSAYMAHWGMHHIWPERKAKNSSKLSVYRQRAEADTNIFADRCLEVIKTLILY